MINVDGRHCPASSDCCPASVGLLSAINRIPCPYSSKYASCIAGVQFVLPQPSQQILNLIDGLDRRRRIINGRGQRFDGDVYQQANWIFRVLFRRPFSRQVDAPHQVAFVQRSFCTMNLKQLGVLNKRVANPACHHDDGSCLLPLPNQVIDIQFGDRARGGEICQRLYSWTQFRVLSSLSSDVRLITRFLIKTLERLANDLATFVPEQVKYVCNLEVA
jgi:hypothetical protein